MAPSREWGQWDVLVPRESTMFLSTKTRAFVCSCYSPRPRIILESRRRAAPAA